MAGKVLFTASTFSHIRNFHLPYIRWFHEMGWQVHVACGGRAERIENADSVIELPFEKKMSSPANFTAAAKLRGIIASGRYDLISTHTALAAFFTRLAVKGMRDRPRVMNIVHGYLFDDETPTAKRAILLGAERMTAGETDMLVTMNQWDLDFARGHGLGRRVESVPGMGVDFSRFGTIEANQGASPRREWDIPKEAFLLVYPAEFSERKSQRVLIEAMAKLPDRCVLALPGQGATLDQCRDLAARLELSRRIIFPGQISDMGRWYADSDAAVTASRSEGLPFNVMEAMHFELPVVASRVKGHTDLIDDGVDGFLYTYGDPDACAGAIRRLMDSDGLRRSLGTAAGKRAEEYSLERVFPRVKSLYSQLLPEIEGEPAGLEA